MRHLDERALALLVPLAHQAHVGADARLRVLGEVAAGESGEQAQQLRDGAGIAQRLAQQARRALLPFGDDLLAFGVQQIGAAAQERQRARVQLGEQRLFPAGHRVRRDRSEIAERQQVKLAQLLLVAAHRAEVRDHPEVL